LTVDENQLHIVKTSSDTDTVDRDQLEKYNTAGFKIGMLRNNAS